jgi:hypothetical protein
MIAKQKAQENNIRAESFLIVANGSHIDLKRVT